MSDHDIRSLERLAATGDAAALVRLVRARERTAARAPRLGEWTELYCDLPNGLWARDYRHWIELVEATDLDSACGASGLVLVEAGTVCVPDRRWKEALAVVGQEPGWAEDLGRDVVDHGAHPREARERVRLAVAEALWRYGAGDRDTGDIVWHERPTADPCAAVPPCARPNGRADACRECLANGACECECHAEHARARRERGEQLRLWDGWRPTGYHRDERTGERTADYVGDAGLQRAIRELGPEVGE